MTIGDGITGVAVLLGETVGTWLKLPNRMDGVFDGVFAGETDEEIDGVFAGVKVALAATLDETDGEEFKLTVALADDELEGVIGSHERR
jgi:hypothetical protein